MALVPAVDPGPVPGSVPGPVLGAGVQSLRFSRPPPPEGAPDGVDLQCHSRPRGGARTAGRTGWGGASHARAVAQAGAAAVSPLRAAAVRMRRTAAPGADRDGLGAPWVKGGAGRVTGNRGWMGKRYVTAEWEKGGHGDRGGNGGTSGNGDNGGVTELGGVPGIGAIAGVTGKGRNEGYRGSGGTGTTGAEGSGARGMEV